MRLSYIPVLMLLFLLCSVYAIDKDSFEFPVVNDIDSQTTGPITPINTQTSLIPQMPADFVNILSAGLIGVTIGILLAALAYMVGNFFSFPQMIGWSKNQLWESLYSMLLVSSVLIFSMVVHLFPVGVPEAIQYNSQISFPEKAAISIDNVVHGEIDLAELPKEVKKELLQNKYVTTNNLGVTNLFFTVYAYQLFLDSVYNIVSINFLTLGNFGSKQATATTATTGSVNFEGQLLSGLKKLMSLSSIVTNYLMTLIMVLYVQMSALIFIAGGSVFLFMFGVFFRCLPVTRKLGSTLIALFITLYFVYPAFVIFVYSDGMYGKMSEEFSGAYTESHWFNDMTGFDPNGLIFNTPFGLTQVNDTNFGKGEVVLRFYSNSFSEYNYTVTKGYKTFEDDPDLEKLISDPKNILCSGIAKNGEIVECDLKGTIPSDYTMFDPNVGFKDKESIEKAEIEPVNYYVQLKSEAHNYIVETDEFKYGIATYPEDPVPFPVFYSKPCNNSDRCDQIASQASISLEKDASDFVNEYMLGTIVEGSLTDMISGDSVTSDAIVTGAKVYGTVALQKNLAQVTSKTTQKAVEKGGRYLLKKGVPRWLVKIGIGTSVAPLTIASFILRSAMFKNDVSSFIYDEMTCDYYTTTIAQQHFGESNFPEPTFSKNSLENIFSSLGTFVKGVGVETFDSSFKYYSESDYTSCAGSLGLVNYATSKVASLFYGEEVKLRQFHVTTIFAPIVYVFISFIYTIIFCVTFFRSLSESIGGDSSLMGLSKII